MYSLSLHLQTQNLDHTLKYINFVEEWDNVIFPYVP